MAGLWETWSPKTKSATTNETQPDDLNVIQSCTILRINANADMQSFHDRMPVILPIEAWASWLNPTTEKAELETLLKPFENGHLIRSTVSTIVNRAVVDSPECIAPLTADGNVRQPFQADMCFLGERQK